MTSIIKAGWTATVSWTTVPGDLLARLRVGCVHLGVGTRALFHHLELEAGVGEALLRCSSETSLTRGTDTSPTVVVGASVVVGAAVVVDAAVVAGVAGCRRARCGLGGHRAVGRIGRVVTATAERHVREADGQQRYECHDRDGATSCGPWAWKSAPIRPSGTTSWAAAVATTARSGSR